MATMESSSEDFRTTSVHFKALPWRTNVLCTPGGLDQLQVVPELSVSVSQIHLFPCCTNILLSRT